MNDSPMQSLAQFQSNTSNIATTSIASSGSSSSIYMSSIISTVSLAFTSGGNNNSQSNPPASSSSTSTSTTNQSSSSLSMLTQMQAAQINELNAIMACVAMFANSMVSKEDDLDSSNDYQSSLSLSIIDSIMVLLEPLMLCSGGVTYTMRYFLNEISLHIPELKLSIHENLLKILSQILTGKPLYQIIQAISVSASHLIRSNNLYSLMSNTGVSSTPFDSQNVNSLFLFCFLFLFKFDYLISFVLNERLKISNKCFR